MSVIVKADGTSEEFNKQKLLTSLHRAGASSQTSEHIATEIEKELYKGITTREVYSRAFAHLRGEAHGLAARYSLKRAVLEFGPSGFPFESYVAELFNAEGYTTLVDQIIKGACVEHEVDVVITKGSQTIYAEAKFHNTPGFKSDLKTVLYVKARVDDILAAHPDNANLKGLVVTNTKFSDRALQYAQCQRLELLSWDYPQDATLHHRIEKVGLYPVTALATLSRREKMALLEDRVVLCKALPNQTDILVRAGVPSKKIELVLEEVGALCSPQRAI